MMINSLLHNRRLHLAATLVSMGGALLLSACVSTPEPALAMSAAQQAISAAERGRNAGTPSPELTEAHEKLTAAETAIRADKMDKAEHLALESRVDAELASAKFAAAKEQSANDEIRRSTNMLTQEMQRNSGVKQ
ncbi:MAG TPA: DUF4398 domain-containing protein [Steroidobacteraceae bacterium]|jgi:hypothetical protein|nr:DUF4398 domain-containing protein [Steroidobacteraceae bacterium]